MKQKACRTSSVSRALNLNHEVMGSNLPAVPEVTLGGQSSASITIPRCKNWDQSLIWATKFDSEVDYMQMTLVPPVCFVTTKQFKNKTKLVKQ